MSGRRPARGWLAATAVALLAAAGCSSGGGGHPAAATSSAAPAPATARAGAAPAAAGTGAAVAAATTSLTSFDGTKIVVHLFPAAGLRAGGRAPTVLDGPGWGLAGESDPDGGSVGPLRAAGYNVLTWDPRGFGGSGGTAQVDYGPFEGRDVTMLVGWLATRPEAQLDGTGDPRVGMVGASYGGGIQFVAAAADPRIDVIVPTIAWHSLVESLYPDGADKTGWGNLLCEGATAGTNRVDGHVAEACRLAKTGSNPDAATLAWYADHTPPSLLARVRVPTLIFQGTVDTLFPLRQGIENYDALRGRVPVKMVWFCGGHGTCLTPAGAADHMQQLTLAWLGRYLRGQTGTATGPGFEYVDDTGTWRGADAYPLAGAGSLAGDSTGRLALDPEATSGSATAAAAAPSDTAVEVGVHAPAATGEIVGAPRLALDYQGSAAPADTVVYAQLVDTGRRLVLGNQATPIPVHLDGRKHTATVELADVAWHVTPASHLVMQLVAGTKLYAPQHSRGRVSLTAAVTVPLARPGTVIPAT